MRDYSSAPRLATLSSKPKTPWQVAKPDQGPAPGDEAARTTKAGRSLDPTLLVPTNNVGSWVYMQTPAI